MAPAVLDPATEKGADENHPDGNLEGQRRLRLAQLERIRFRQRGTEDAPRLDSPEAELKQERSANENPPSSRGLPAVAVPTDCCPSDDVIVGSLLRGRTARLVARRSDE